MHSMDIAAGIQRITPITKPLALPFRIAVVNSPRLLVGVRSSKMNSVSLSTQEVNKTISNQQTIPTMIKIHNFTQSGLTVLMVNMQSARIMAEKMDDPDFSFLLKVLMSFQGFVLLNGRPEGRPNVSKVLL